MEVEEEGEAADASEDLARASESRLRQRAIVRWEGGDKSQGRLRLQVS